MEMQDEGYGFGSVYQRASDGLWMAVCQAPRRRGRARERTTFASKTREGVVAKLTAYREANPTHTTPGLGRAAYMDHARSLGTHKPREWWSLVRAVERRCYYCGCDASRMLTKDHQVPVSRGGSDAIDNLAVACEPCNIEKDTMTAVEYMAWRSEQGVNRR